MFLFVSLSLDLLRFDIYTLSVFSKLSSMLLDASPIL